MRRLLVFAALSTSLVSTAAFALPEAAPTRVERGVAGGDENASLRRTLAAALVVKKLDLTTDQKREMLSIIADAKQLRERAKNAIPANERKAVLEKAISEARATGELSADTRERMRAMRDRVKANTGSMKADRQALRERMEKVLTPAQLEKIKEGRRERQLEGKRNIKKAMWLRLLMSDEFAAELSR